MMELNILDETFARQVAKAKLVDRRNSETRRKIRKASLGEHRQTSTTTSAGANAGADRGTGEDAVVNVVSGAAITSVAGVETGTDIIKKRIKEGLEDRNALDRDGYRFRGIFDVISKTTAESVVPKQLPKQTPIPHPTPLHPTRTRTRTRTRTKTRSNYQHRQHHKYYGTATATTRTNTRSQTEKQKYFGGAQAAIAVAKVEKIIADEQCALANARKECEVESKSADVEQKRREVEERADAKAAVEGAKIFVTADCTVDKVARVPRRMEIQKAIMMHCKKNLADLLRLEMLLAAATAAEEEAERIRLEEEARARAEEEESARLQAAEDARLAVEAKAKAIAAAEEAKKADRRRSQG